MKPEPLYLSLSNILKRFSYRGNSLFSDIMRSWEKIIGKELASMVSPIALKKRHIGYLLVLSVSAQKSLEASYNLDGIKSSLNDFCGQDLITEIRLEKKDNKKKDNI